MPAPRETGAGVVLGVTGHRRYPADVAAWLEARVGSTLTELRPSWCVTSLAEGADQLVARLALEQGVPIHAVIPARDYHPAAAPGEGARFEDLLARAAQVTVLDRDHADDDAYLAAGLAMLDASDALLAVWDGGPARGRGGTAEIVTEARSRGLPVTILWPARVRR